MLATAALLLLAPEPRPLEPLTLATYAYPAYDRAAALEPMRELLARRLGRPVEVRLFPTPERLAEALADGRADVAMTNLAAYARVGRRPEVRAVAVLDVPAATLERYRGVLLARRATGLTSAAGAAARAGSLRLSEVMPGSTSGGLVQAGRLRRIDGLPARFADRRYAGTHEAALGDLLAGRADVAALAEEPWLKLRRERPDAAAGIVEIWRSAPLPPGPVVCVEGARLACADVAAALLAGDADGRRAARALAAGWSETAGAAAFAPVAPAAYGAFLEASDAAPAGGR